ncbi:cytotoxic and regulatory T-cell molecule [Python bivittatus]|uniref:Cytotoxic and regulatory T-cell molecule n=1 Tax=Python bivittatus TaxID=176946 RepID=A0A9F5IP89_PYTBI|nr:cytotoxic and regulatory T-cell molecule [Python bivittatus]
MPSLPQVWVLAFVSLQGTLSVVLIEHLSLEEGQNLDLHCVNNKGNSSALEWKDPLGFVIFFNTWQGVRDGRYGLLRYSKDVLSIRLSNVTIHDEGLYTCLYYSKTVGGKLVNVTVFAPPSKPLLEALRTTVDHTEENTVLRCSTEGCWPAPQITWLLQNGMEIFGDTQHQMEAKKFHSVSNLTIYAFPQGSVISCVIHHKALGRRNLTATLHLEHANSDEIFNTTKGSFNTPTASLTPEVATLQTNSTNEQKQNITEETFSIPTLSPTREAATQSSDATKESGTIFNVTEGNSTTQTPFPSTDTEVWAINQTNVTYKGFVERQTHALFPGLVSILLLVLFIMILLLAVKLWKAHRDWKKENDASDQTIESYRPKANEAPCRPQIKCEIPWRNSKKYIIQESYTKTPKSSDESQDSSVFEKEFFHIKETDI